MQFHIAGQNVYRLQIPLQPLFDEDGNELDGLCIEAARRILISPRVEIERREEVLLHELRHAWAFHVPAATDDESDCQLFASIGQQLRHDLESQGGVAVLLAMRPGPVNISLPAEPQRRISSIGADTPGVADRVACGVCGAETMCGDVEHGRVEFHEASRSHRIDRWVRCEFCGVLTVWREFCSSDGQLAGKIVAVPKPMILRGAEAPAWIERHQAMMV